MIKIRLECDFSVKQKDLWPEKNGGELPGEFFIKPEEDCFLAQSAQELPH